MNASTATGFVHDGAASENFRIGQGLFTSADEYIEGVLDDIRYYNRVISPEQIQALYNNRTDLIVSNETNEGEDWKVCVTPNDGQNNGNESCSADLEVAAANNIPKVTKPVFNESVLYSYMSLGANSTYTDSDLHTGTVTFYWYVDNVNVYNQTFNSVSTGSVLTSVMGADNYSKNQSH